VKYDFWRIDVGSLSAPRALAIKCMRILVAALQGFAGDNCSFRASALTLCTLLSIVPVLALAFGIAQGFGLEKAIERELFEELRGQEEVARWIVTFAYSFLNTTKGGLIAGVGVLALLLTVVKVLRDVEKAFNEIWKTREQRSIPRTISDYLTIIIVAPILLVASSSLMVVIKSGAGAQTSQMIVWQYISPALLPILKILPYCVIWALFTFIYMSMPNTRVNFRSGLLGGIIAGTVFELFQSAYITFQVGVSKYNAIYGSFAALPLFIIWLQTSWLIVLFGAEISYACQNSEDYLLDPEKAKISHKYKMLLALNICYIIIKNFQTAARCCTLEYISRTLQISMSLVRGIIEELVEAELICATFVQPHQEGTKDGCVIYQPASPTDRFSIKYVIDSLESHGVSDLPVNAEQGFTRIAEKVEALADTLKRAPSNILLKDL